MLKLRSPFTHFTMKSVLRFLPVLVLPLFFAGCDPETELTNTVYKDEMRQLVEELSAYGKEKKPGFLVIPQNGQELITVDGNAGSDTELAYLNAIDAVGREDLFYGYIRDNRATPEDETERMLEYLVKCKENGIAVLVTDYCSSEDKMNDSYLRNRNYGFVSFAAPDRELGVIPGYPESPEGKNQDNIHGMAEVRNFLYLINPVNYASEAEFIAALENTDYDLLLIDAFGPEGELMQNSDLSRLKEKASGGQRLLIAYLSIGEAEDYRYYWKEDWNNNPPSWMEAENPDWQGNYKVRYWDSAWKAILFGNENAYLDKILSAGFDGVYLDIIDAFEYFENLE